MPDRCCDERKGVTVKIGGVTGRDLMADGKPSLRRSEMEIVPWQADARAGEGDGHPLKPS
jgi:hypothetical protein